MAKQYGITNLRTFEADLNKFDSAIKKGAGNILAKAAEDCFREIVASSPFLTGSYIASHRISINNEDNSDTIYQLGEASEGAVRAEALQQLNKLRDIKATDKIYISNSVGLSNSNHYSWAANVEYTGWYGKKSGTYRGPYLVYEKAMIYVMNQMPKYITSIRVSGEGV